MTNLIAENARSIVVWIAGSIITFFVVTALMTRVYSYVLIALWSVFAWPIYLPWCVVSAIRNA